MTAQTSLIHSVIQRRENESAKRDPTGCNRTKTSLIKSTLAVPGPASALEQYSHGLILRSTESIAKLVQKPIGQFIHKLQWYVCIVDTPRSRRQSAEVRTTRVHNPVKPAGWEPQTRDGKGLHTRDFA
jgi:hypothetical protein